MEPEGTYFLLYDGECRICTAFARAVAALDIRGTLRARPLQDSRDLLGGMPEEEILGAAHVVAPDGQVTTGAAAMPRPDPSCWTVAASVFASRIRSGGTSLNAIVE